jgi:hypothetical protein
MELGYEQLRRHDLRHTGLTWTADAGARCTSCGRSPGMAPPDSPARRLSGRQDSNLRPLGPQRSNGPGWRSPVHLRQVKACPLRPAGCLMPSHDAPSVREA